jgi:hypothetical protein
MVDKVALCKRFEPPFASWQYSIEIEYRFQNLDEQDPQPQGGPKGRPYYGRGLGAQDALSRRTIASMTTSASFSMIILQYLKSPYHSTGGL